MSAADRVPDGARRRRRVTTLKEACLRVLSKHASALRGLDGVPDSLIAGILQRSALRPAQLAVLEKANAHRDISHLTAPLWAAACASELKLSAAALKRSGEHPRELYRRTKLERAEKIKASMAKIKQSHDAAAGAAPARSKGVLPSNRRPKPKPVPNAAQRRRSTTRKLDKTLGKIIAKSRVRDNRPPKPKPKPKTARVPAKRRDAKAAVRTSNIFD